MTLARSESHFLNNEFSIRLPSMNQFKNGRGQTRESGREDLTSSNQDFKTDGATLVFRRGVQGSCFILRRLFLSTLALEKIWRDILLDPTSLFWCRPFLNWVMEGSRIDNSLFKKVTLLVKFMAYILAW